MNNEEAILTNWSAGNRHVPNSRLHKGNKTTRTVRGLLRRLLSAWKSSPFLVDSRDVSSPERNGWKLL